MAPDPIFNSCMPGLGPQDKNGRAGVAALPLKRIANFTCCYNRRPSGEQPPAGFAWSFSVSDAVMTAPMPASVRNVN